MTSSAVREIRQDVVELLPPRALADGTLRRLQETALVLFAERGYHGVSMRELAAAAGIRASSIYAHVTAKEDLLLQLLRLAHAEHSEGMRRAALDAAGGDPAEQLSAVMKAHVRFHAAYPMLAAVANTELRSLTPSTQPEVLALRSEAESLLRDIIDRGVRLRMFACPDTWLAFAALGSMGIRVAFWISDSAYSVDEVCDRYAEFALRVVGCD